LPSQQNKDTLFIPYFFFKSNTLVLESEQVFFNRPLVAGLDEEHSRNEDRFHNTSQKTKSVTSGQLQIQLNTLTG